MFKPYTCNKDVVKAMLLNCDDINLMDQEILRCQLANITVDPKVIKALEDCRRKTYGVLKQFTEIPIDGEKKDAKRLSRRIIK